MMMLKLKVKRFVPQTGNLRTHGHNLTDYGQPPVIFISNRTYTFPLIRGLGGLKSRYFGPLPPLSGGL